MFSLWIKCVYGINEANLLFVNLQVRSMMNLMEFPFFSFQITAEYRKLIFVETPSMEKQVSTIIMLLLMLDITQL